MSRYLLDTQAIIFHATGSDQLSEEAKAIFQSDYQLLISPVSIWEMAIKVSIGKLVFDQDFRTMIMDEISVNQYEILEISLNSIFRVQQLPFIHKDPFDRLLIAQAITENIPIVSSDLVFDQYMVSRIW